MRETKISLFANGPESSTKGTICQHCEIIFYQNLLLLSFIIIFGVIIMQDFFFIPVNLVKESKIYQEMKLIGNIR